VITSVAAAVDVASFVSLVVVMLDVFAGVVAVRSLLVVIFVDTTSSLLLDVEARFIVVTALSSTVLTSVVVMLVLAVGIVAAASFVPVISDVISVSVE